MRLLGAGLHFCDMATGAWYSLLDAMNARRNECLTQRILAERRALVGRAVRASSRPGMQVRVQLCCASVRIGMLPLRRVAHFSVLVTHAASVLFQALSGAHGGECGMSRTTWCALSPKRWTPATTLTAVAAHFERCRHEAPTVPPLRVRSSLNSCCRAALRRPSLRARPRGSLAGGGACGRPAASASSSACWSCSCAATRPSPSATRPSSQ